MLEAIAAPAETTSVVVAHQSPKRFRKDGKLLLAVVLLVLLPVCVYWNTTWAHFGMRDDYGIMREAREEQGKEIEFCGSHARPVYGYLLHAEFQFLDHIGDLSWARLTGSVMLGVLAAGTCCTLVVLLGWPLLAAVGVSALLVLVPSGQVFASWAILWPYVFAALLSMGAFVLAETAFRPLVQAPWKRGVLTSMAAVLVILSVWTNQPVCLYYLVFIAAVVAWRGRGLELATRVRLIKHFLLFGGALLTAYALIRVAFATGLLPMSKRIAFDSDFLGKLVWYAQHALPNALGLFVLNDLYGRTAPYYQIAVALTSLLLLSGGLLVGRRYGWREGLTWFGGLLVLAIGSYSINLVAAERFFSYRTIFPLVGVVLVFLVSTLVMVGELFPRLMRARHWLVVGVVAVAALIARQQAYALFALPQHQEFRLVEQEMKKLDLVRDQRVYVITPTPEIAPAPLLSTDEFGSLSTDSDWVPKEIMKHILYEKSPEQPPSASLDHMVSGELPPPPGRYEVVIDLRGLGAVGSAPTAPQG